MNRREFAQSLAAAAALGSPQTQNRDAAGGSLTDVRGIRVGHFTDTRRPTGCTAILFDTAVAAGVDYNGSAPGESMVVMLQPVSPVEKIHALFLTGGGIFALHAHSGVLRYLEEHKVGFDWGTPDLRIPIVVSAVIDDLAVGDPHPAGCRGRVQGVCGRHGLTGTRGERRRRRRRDRRQDAPRPRPQRHEGRDRHRQPHCR